MTGSETRSARPDPDLLQWLIHCRSVPPGLVGKSLDRSRAVGYSWLRRYGINACVRSVAQEELVAVWRSGRSLGDLSRQTSLSATAVRERLVTAGAYAAHRSYLTVDSTDDPLNTTVLRELGTHQGLGARQIAELTRTTARQVRYRLYLLALNGGGPSPPAPNGTEPHPVSS